MTITKEEIEDLREIIKQLDIEKTKLEEMIDVTTKGNILYAVAFMSGIGSGMLLLTNSIGHVLLYEAGKLSTKALSIEEEGSYRSLRATFLLMTEKLNAATTVANDAMQIAKEERADKAEVILKETLDLLKKSVKK